MKTEFLRIDIMDDMTQLEIDNLCHEIDGLVGVFSVTKVTTQQNTQKEDCPCGGEHVPEPICCKNCGLYLT